MTKTDELKTKRERIIHNEQVKLTASFIVNLGLILVSIALALFLLRFPIL